MNSIYDYKAITMQGTELSMADLKGKVLLIVNTASKCGLTPQFKALEDLHKKYESQGLVIIGFPCDQFAGQELSNNNDINAFCTRNYGVSFQMMQKIDVNGKNAHPLYKFLKEQAGGFLFDAIKWNFTKFLVSRDGTQIKRFAPYTKPEKIEDDIRKLL